MNKKGQIFSTDALLALIVFTLVLAVTIGLLTQIQTTGENAVRSQTQTHITEQIIMQLLSSPGSPRNWETYTDRNNVKMIGLIDHEGGISTDKWNQLQDWNSDDYSSLKTWLGIPDRNIYITISDVNHSTLEAAGLSPSDVNSVSTAVLPSFFDGELVFVQVQVYQR